MEETGIINNNQHGEKRKMQVLIDSGKKYFTSIAVTFTVFIVSTIWAVFIRPQIVMASDLKTVVDQVQELREEVQVVNDNVNTLAISQCNQQKYYLQDQISVLEVRAVDRPLSAAETQRLIYYRNALQKLKCE